MVSKIPYTSFENTKMNIFDQNETKHLKLAIIYTEGGFSGEGISKLMLNYEMFLPRTRTKVLCLELNDKVPIWQNKNGLIPKNKKNSQWGAILGALEKKWGISPTLGVNQLGWDTTTLSGNPLKDPMFLPNLLNHLDQQPVIHDTSS